MMDFLQFLLDQLDDKPSKNEFEIKNVYSQVRKYLKIKQDDPNYNEYGECTQNIFDKSTNCEVSCSNSNDQDTICYKTYHIYDHIYDTIDHDKFVNTSR